MAKSAIRFLALSFALLLALPTLSARAAEPAFIEITTTSAIIQYPEQKQRISVAFDYRCYSDDGEQKYAWLQPAISHSGPTYITCDGAYRSATSTTVGAGDPGRQLVKAEIAGQATSQAWITVMPALPDAVASMTLSKATSTSMQVAWTAPPPRENGAGTKILDTSITGYKIGWTEGSTGRSWESNSPHYRLGASPVTLTGLIPNASYDVYVIPVNPSGDGASKHRTLSTLPSKSHAPYRVRINAYQRGSSTSDESMCSNRTHYAAVYGYVERWSSGSGKYVGVSSVRPTLYRGKAGSAWSKSSVSQPTKTTASGKWTAASVRATSSAAFRATWNAPNGKTYAAADWYTVKRC
jgi:Fibronectin type III domain